MASRITRTESNPVNAVVDRMNRKPPTIQFTSHARANDDDRFFRHAGIIGFERGFYYGRISRNLGSGVMFLASYTAAT